MRSPLAPFSAMATSITLGSVGVPEARFGRREPISIDMFLELETDEPVVSLRELASTLEEASRRRALSALRDLGSGWHRLAWSTGESIRYHSAHLR